MYSLTAFAISSGIFSACRTRDASHSASEPSTPCTWRTALPNEAQHVSKMAFNRIFTTTERYAHFVGDLDCELCNVLQHQLAHRPGAMCAEPMPLRALASENRPPVEDRSSLPHQDISAGYRGFAVNVFCVAKKRVVGAGVMTSPFPDSHEYPSRTMFKAEAVSSKMLYSSRRTDVPKRHALVMVHRANGAFHLPSGIWPNICSSGCQDYMPRLQRHIQLRMPLLDE